MVASPTTRTPDTRVSEAKPVTLDAEVLCKYAYDHTVPDVGREMPTSDVGAVALVPSPQSKYSVTAPRVPSDMLEVTTLYTVCKGPDGSVIPRSESAHVQRVAVAPTVDAGLVMAAGNAMSAPEPTTPSGVGSTAVAATALPIGVIVPFGEMFADCAYAVPLEK